MKKKERVLTENQQKFLDVLFEEAQGDLVKAKKLAGYSDNVGTTSIVTALHEEIRELTIKMFSGMSCRKLHSNSSFPFRNYWIEETDDVNAVFHHFFCKILCQFRIV